MAPLLNTTQLIFIIVLISIPVHALVLGYFLNPRWFRVKKRRILKWLDKKGVIEFDETEHRRI